MRRLARELHGTEVAFVRPPRPPTTTSRSASSRRVARCPSSATRIAARYVRAIANGVPKGKVRQKSGTSIVEVEVTGKAPAPTHLHQSPASFGVVAPDDRRAPVLDALGISSAASTPPPDAGDEQVELAPADRPQLARGTRVAQPDMQALVQLAPRVGADGFFVFAMRPDSDPFTTSRACSARRSACRKTR